VCIMTVDNVLCIAGGVAYLEEKEGRAWNRQGGGHTKVPNKLLITKQYAYIPKAPTFLELIFVHSLVLFVRIYG